MNNHLIARIASILIGTVLGVVIIFFGFRIFQSLFSHAGDVAPRDVVVTEITQNSSKITWSTGEENQGVVEYGTSPTALNFFAPESTKAKTHSVDLTLLSPASTYYFQIRIADQKYDNGGVPWTFTTKGAGTSQSDVGPTTAAPTRPTPVATIVVPDENGDAAATCTETDCDKIRAKIGNGCNVSDYIACTSKATATPAQ